MTIDTETMLAALCLANYSKATGVGRYQKARALLCSAFCTADGAYITDAQFIAAEHDARDIELDGPSEEALESSESECKALEDERDNAQGDWADCYNAAQGCIALIDSAEGGEGIDPDEIEELLSNIYGLIDDLPIPPEGL